MTGARAQKQPQKSAPSAKRAIRQGRRRELLRRLPEAIERLGPGASMEEIAAEVGITKPVLYKHFGSRGGLAEALAWVYLENFRKEVTSSLQGTRTARELLRTLLDSYFAFVERHQAFVAFIVAGTDQSALSPEARDAAARTALSQGLAYILRGALEARGLDTRPAASWGRSLQFMIEGTAFSWLADRGLAREELVDHLFQLIWAGVGPVFDDPAPAAAELEGPSQGSGPARRTES